MNINKSMDYLSLQFRQQQGLDIEDTGDELLVYRSAGDYTYYLNGTAALVMKLCNGERIGSEIVALLCEAFPGEESINNDVLEALKQLVDRGLIATE